MTIPPYSKIPLSVSLHQNSSTESNASLGKRKLLEEPSFPELKKNRAEFKDFDWAPMPPLFCATQLDEAVARSVEDFFQPEPSDPMALSLPSPSFNRGDSRIYRETTDGLLRHLSADKSSMEESSPPMLALSCSKNEDEKTDSFFQSFFKESSTQPAVSLLAPPRLQETANPVFSFETGLLTVATTYLASSNKEQQICDDEVSFFVGLDSEESDCSSSGMDSDNDPLEDATKSFVSLSLLGKGGAFTRKK